QAYSDFVAGGGDLYVPTPSEKAAFKEAAAPVYEWFKQNVDGGEAAFDALVSSVASAEESLSAVRAADMQ
ncbi:MAG: C4-dicarboxylate ABC transporter substrate-binding protein, partial [Pseudomonadota bacterium]